MQGGHPAFEVAVVFGVQNVTFTQAPVFASEPVESEIVTEGFLRKKSVVSAPRLKHILPAILVKNLNQCTLNR